VAEVCDIVAERGARLAGAGIVGIIKKLGRIESRKSVVTVEGGLYEHYRVFRNYLHSSVWEMLGSDHSDNVVIEHSHGGSGAGAVFLAACQNTKSSWFLAHTWIYEITRCSGLSVRTFSFYNFQLS